jgi:hypothetical protein
MASGCVGVSGSPRRRNPQMARITQTAQSVGIGERPSTSQVCLE